jgi:hypothetical protein
MTPAATGLKSVVLRDVFSLLHQSLLAFSGNWMSLTRPSVPKRPARSDGPVKWIPTVFDKNIGAVMRSRLPTMAYLDLNDEMPV